MNLLLAFVSLGLMLYGAYCAVIAWENRLRDGPFPTLFNLMRFNPRGRRHVIRFWVALVTCAVLLWITWHIT